MPEFSLRFLDEIRARLPLSEAIGQKIRVSRAGREFKACCPFHKEKTPSFTINDDKGFYHCFGCGAHGDIIGWTMQYENRSFPEAVEQLANLAGLEMPKSSPQEAAVARAQKNLYELMEAAAHFMEGELRDLKNRGAYEYILKRGLSEDTLNAFRIGFAGEDRQALYRHLKAQGYDEAQMIECGLIRKDKRGEPYAFFRERIMFPVTDKRGRIVAFGGRILPDNLRLPEQGSFTPPKYINSIDTPLFHKGRMLYGAAHANFAAREGAPLIVTEGYLDVIACWQAGIKGAVAPLGTALTEEQITQLWRMDISDFKAPVLCFDGDEAGRRAAYRAATRVLPLLRAAHSLKFVFLPEGEDPDTLINQHGRGAFEDTLSRATPLIEFLFAQETEGKSFNTPEERAGLSHALENYTSQIQDTQVQFHYRSAFRDKTYQFFRALQKGQYTGGQKHGKESQIIPLKNPNQNQDFLIERLMLAQLILFPEIFHDIEERLGALALPHPGLDNIRCALFNKLEGEIKLDSEEVKSHLISVGLEGELSYTLNDSVLVHAGFIKGAKEYHDLLKDWDNLWMMSERQKQSRQSDNSRF